MSIHSKKPPIKIIASCVLGTFFEFFDYSLYGYFAGTIGHLFFPEQSPGFQLLATWAIFSIGFLIRPLGATLFGFMADRKGRRKILSYTIALMAVPTVVMGLLPTFESIGWFAPLLLLLCRLTQGLAIGAEYNVSSIYILENKWRRPGFLGSFTPFAGGMGMLAASFTAYLFMHNIHEGFNSWEWRLPFIITGLLIGFMVWYLRRTMQETEDFQELKDTNQILMNPLKHILKDSKLPLLANIVCSAYMGSAIYLLIVYMSTYLHQEFKLSFATALICTSVAAFIESSSCLLFGWISDYFARWKTLFFSSLLMAIVSFLFIIKPNLTVAELIFSLMVFVFILGAFDGPLTMYLPELFNTKTRYSSASIS